MKWRWNSSNNQFEIRTISKFENFLLCNYVYSINAQKGINWKWEAQNLLSFLFCVHTWCLWNY